MSPEAKAKLGRDNDAAISRMAARREVRRLRKNKKKVPSELLTQAGFSDGAPLVSTRKRKVVITKTVAAGPVEVKVSRQQAAKALGIKNRRWLNAAELDEAIACKHVLAAGTSNVAFQSARPIAIPRIEYAGIRLPELEQLGRDRCRAAWDAWKAKQ